MNAASGMTVSPRLLSVNVSRNASVEPSDAEVSIDTIVQ
jgi:hypothetical protein